MTSFQYWFTYGCSQKPLVQFAACVHGEVFGRAESKEVTAPAPAPEAAPEPEQVRRPLFSLARPS